jgi:hypothetical protein
MEPLGKPIHQLKNIIAINPRILNNVSRGDNLPQRKSNHLSHKLSHFKFKVIIAHG